MLVAIVHNALIQSSAPDELDVLVQVEAVADALQRLGHRTEIVPCDLNLSAVADRLVKLKPDLVFNLVESLAGSGRLIHCFPALLETLGMPYSGASAEALFLTSNKVLAKSRLSDRKVPTPMWFCAGGSRSGRLCPDSADWPRRWIIKSVWEHASVGLDEKSIVADVDAHRLSALLTQRAPLLGGDCFAEAFIEGREFNLSLIGALGAPEVLPPAEIRFEGFTEDQPRIVDYSAKWNLASYGYHHTPRTFDFEERDRPLLERLAETALQCWDLFGLSGYARVDFRVDGDNRPWVLEINTNPCISPDAGFAAAVQRSGMTYAQAIEMILTSSHRVEEGTRRFDAPIQGECRA